MRKLQEEKLSTQQLHAAKQQYIGQLAINNELALNEMQGIGKSCLTYGKVDTLEEMALEIEAVGSDEIRDLANTIFGDERMSLLIYH